MKPTEALKKAFNLKKGQELSSVMPEEQLFCVLKAMKLYGEYLCREQRLICQFDFEHAVENDRMQNSLPSSLWYMYNERLLKTSQPPQFD